MKERRGIVMKMRMMAAERSWSVRVWALTMSRAALLTSQCRSDEGIDIHCLCADPT